MQKRIPLEGLRDIDLRPQGLTDGEVAAQRVRFGTNTIVENASHPWLDLLLDTGKDPMIWFLFGIGAVFLLVGEKGEALILFAATVPLLLMDAFLHWRTYASTMSLRGQLASHALAVRGGVRVLIDSREVVPGDLIVIDAGQPFVPADGFWENARSLQVDESVLTGEAFPISKKTMRLHPEETKEWTVDTDQLGFAGTRALTGEGLLRVLSTSKSTAYGEIVQSVVQVTHERTALQIAITRLTKNLIVIAGLLCCVLAWIRYRQGHGWLDALLSAATLAVAAIPEEFPVVFVFFLGVGVYRLARSRVLVRRAVSVENIGRVTQICTDKTGTITSGEVRLTHVDPSESVSRERVLLLAGIASNSQGTDPVDVAIFAALERQGSKPLSRVGAIPFTEDRKRETAFVCLEGAWFCALKGSPETVLQMSSFSPVDKARWSDKVRAWACEGHKVLAVGFRAVGEAEAFGGTEPTGPFQFAGLLAFEDPPRPEVRSAVEYCKRNSIKVMMITGDHPETASAVAREIGLGERRPVLLSAESAPEKFEAEWLRSHPETLRGVDVVARCNPMQKLRIVQALKASGELVAVTGDGVNDVPALKAADIGIAMGVRGSRSAKEVSAIILGDDDFSTIVKAIREGRQMFMNLRTSFEYLLLIHIPLVASAALIPLLGYPLLFLPAHIVWLELIVHPTALLAFQVSTAQIPDEKPRRGSAFLSQWDVARILILGGGSTLAVLWLYVDSFELFGNVEHSRSRALLLLPIWSAVLAIVLSRARSRGAYLAAAFSVVSAVVILQIDRIAEGLRLSPLRGEDWLVVIGFAIGGGLVLHLLRRFSDPRLNR